MAIPGDRDKHAWRSDILARRAAVTEDTHAAEANALAVWVEKLEIPEWVCAYVPVRGEPGSTAVLDVLRAAGARVLLPITGPPGPLEWAEYTGAERLRVARWGLREPDGPVLAPDTIARAGLVLVPALAADLRGVRLGRGAGHYDRTLGGAAEDARVVVVVRDDELVDLLPEQSHDVRMGWALTPGGGVRRLGTAE